MMAAKILGLVLSLASVPMLKTEAPIEALETWETGEDTNVDRQNGGNYTTLINYCSKYDYYILWQTPVWNGTATRNELDCIVADNNMEYEDGIFHFRKGLHITQRNGRIIKEVVRDRYEVPSAATVIWTNVQRAPYPIYAEVSNANEANKIINNVFKIQVWFFVFNIVNTMLWTWFFNGKG